MRASALSSFGFQGLFRPPAQPLPRLLANNNVKAFKDSYSKLRRENRLTLSDVRSSLAIASKHNRHQLARRLFNDIQRVFNEEQSHQDHHHLLRAIAKKNGGQDALKWLQSMPLSFGIVPSSQDWEVLLEASVVTQKFNPDPDCLRRLIALLRSQRPKLDLTLYSFLLRCAFRSQDRNLFEQLLKDMRADGIQPDQYIHTILLNAYTDQNNKPKADQAYDLVLKDTEPPSARSWNLRLKYKMAFYGIEAGQAEWQKWKSQPDGPPTDQWTLSHLLYLNPVALYGPGLDPIRQVNRVASEALNESGQEMHKDAALFLLRRLLNEAPTPEEGLQVAQQYYDQIMTGIHSIDPHPDLILPMLQIACQKPDLEYLKRLYQDIDSPSLGIYRSLLLACTQLGPKGVAWAIDLIGDMRQEDRQLASSKEVLNLLFAFLPNCDSAVLAFKIYAFLMAIKPSSFTRKEFQNILQAFADLSLPGNATVPLEIFLEVFKDMRVSGCPPNGPAYHLLLKYFSQIHPRAEQVRRLHDIIKLDNHFDPDTTLMNSLITAYSYVGEYQLAYRVWQSMLANSHRANMRIDEVTVTCILDACAWSGSYQNAQVIWRACKDDPSLKLTLKNWNTWVESLGRLGAIKEAETVVFEEMPALATELHPNQDSIDIIVKFARRSGEADAERVIDRVNQQYPRFTLPAPQPPPTGSPSASEGPLSPSRVFTTPVAGIGNVKMA